MCQTDLGYLRFLPNHLSWQGRILSPMRLNGVRLLQSYLIGEILYYILSSEIQENIVDI